MNKQTMKLQLSAGYYLRFDHIAKLLSIIKYEQNNNLNILNLSQKMGMSPKMIENLSSYSAALGLKRNKKFKIEPLGEIIIEKDPFFQNLKTLWFLHYFLNSNEKYVIWNRIINILLHENQQITSQKAMEYFRTSIGIFKESSLKRNAPKEINAFFNAYTEQNFSKLNYLNKISNSTYKINNDLDIPTLSFLASCYLYRDRFMKGSTGIEIESLIKNQNSPGRIFNLSEHHLRLLLEELNTKRLISLESRANLDQVRFETNKTWLDIVKLFY